jgi:GNAT superfamily N-acetyltransferase
MESSAHEEAFERASAFHTRALELTADTVQEIDVGWVVLTPSLPEVWSLNQLLLAKPIQWTTALQRAEEHLATVPYRHLLADDDGLGRALEASLRRNGFKVERELVMAIAGGTHASPGRAHRIIEPDEPAMIELERRWLLEDDRTTADGLDQLIEAALREGRAFGERRFGIAGDEGDLVALTKLRSHGHTAQVEDVYTAPEARRRGFASTLVAHAVTQAQEAGHDLIFIVADDRDWPKQLYARLGFKPVGRRWTFHRAVS